METLHAGLELHSLLGRDQEVHQQVPNKLSRLVSNLEEIETSNDTDTATLTGHL